MSRKGKIPKRDVLPDPKYNDKIITRFVNGIMKEGKKSLAESILYKSMDRIKEKTKEDPIKVLKKAIDNTKPSVEVRSRRVGGATYQVPIEVRSDRKLALSIRWLTSYAAMRGEKSMIEKLAGELIDAYNSKGGAVKKKEDVHKMAEANKAFAHYRW
ncbi:MAG: 30S ribosomal protein S7 [Deltaproteobacteria bacterium]|nr:30S ribosomal protein S7 [Deltaproteobacteria bacterium]